MKGLGVDAVFGLSTQTPGYQREAAERLHLPFPLISDEKLELSRAVALPLFEAGGETLTERLTLVIDDGVVVRTFYPVFPPDRSAADVVEWLEARA